MIEPIKQSKMKIFKYKWLFATANIHKEKVTNKNDNIKIIDKICIKNLFILIIHPFKYIEIIISYIGC